MTPGNSGYFGSVGMEDNGEMGTVQGCRRAGQGTAQAGRAQEPRPPLASTPWAGLMAPTVLTPRGCPSCSGRGQGREGGGSFSPSFLPGFLRSYTGDHMQTLMSFFILAKLREEEALPYSWRLTYFEKLRSRRALISAPSPCHLEPFFPFPFFFFFYSWFTMLCQFLLYSIVTQSYMYVYIYFPFLIFHHIISWEIG